MTRTETEIEACIKFYTHAGAAQRLTEAAEKENVKCEQMLDAGETPDFALVCALTDAAGKHLAAAREIALSRAQLLLHGKEI